MDCSVCNAPLNSDVIWVKEMMFGSGKAYSYYKCAQCGTLQLKNPDGKLEEQYPDNYYSFRINYKNLLIKIKRTIINYSVLKEIEGKKVLPILSSTHGKIGAHALKGKINFSSKILDVGCGEGTLLKSLYWMGYHNLSGTDPYLPGNLENKKFPLRKCHFHQLNGCKLFDVIMLHHSFEHMDNPFEVMSDIRRLLKDDGLCIIRIPVSDSYAFDYYKENWVQIDAPRHFFLHTNRSMEIITEKSGLKIESIENDSHEFQFIGSEQYKKGIPLNSRLSYFVPIYKRLFFNKKHSFSKNVIKEYKQQAKKLNEKGLGDQRIYYIKKVI